MKSTTLRLKNREKAVEIMRKFQRSYKNDFACNYFLVKADETPKMLFSMNFDGKSPNECGLSLCSMQYKKRFLGSKTAQKPPERERSAAADLTK
ncbi:MAG: hypothetical protein IKC24_00575 [Oscillospiraceae bacterium]|nr:hypothetical protein [Oscillospiraceae bacterium]